MDAGKSKIRALVDLVSGEGPFAGLQMALSVCVLRWWKVQSSSLGLLYLRALIPFIEGSGLMTLSPPEGPTS